MKEPICPELVMASILQGEKEDRWVTPMTHTYLLEELRDLLIWRKGQIKRLTDMSSKLDAVALLNGLNIFFFSFLFSFFMPPAVEAQSLNHWTAREVPQHFFQVSGWRRREHCSFPRSLWPGGMGAANAFPHFERPVSWEEWEGSLKVNATTESSKLADQSVSPTDLLRGFASLVSFMTACKHHPRLSGGV